MTDCVHHSARGAELGLGGTYSKGLYSSPS